MKNYLGYFCILFVLLIAVAACVPQSSQQKQQSTLEELLQIEKYQFTKLCTETKSYVTDANRIASDISNFSWATFSNIGVKRTENGIYKFTVVSTLLPSRNDVQRMLIQCNICLDYWGKIIGNNPYEEPYSVAAKIEKLSPIEWLELCKNLKEGIDVLLTSSNFVRSQVNKKFSIVEVGFKNSHKSVQDEYLQKYQNEKSNYLKLLTNVESNLKQTQIALAKLLDWKFSISDSGSSLKKEYLKRFPDDRRVFPLTFTDADFNPEKEQLILPNAIESGFEIIPNSIPNSSGGGWW